LIQNIDKIEISEKFQNQKKSVGNLQNQLLNSGEFWSGEKLKNQETPGQIRRFRNPGNVNHRFAHKNKKKKHVHKILRAEAKERDLNH
jgi:hypothetical protein